MLILNNYIRGEDTMVTYIKKRDGKVVDFDERKIANAILGAMREMGKADYIAASVIANDITKSINESIIDVESIQDMVEDKLMTINPNVAKAYIKYRQEHSRIRLMNNDIMKHVKKVLNCSDIQNSNANVDEYSFGGRKNEASNVIQKELALNEYIAPEVAEAHRNNELYIHDLSEYTSGDHNCLFANLSKLLNDGFETRNGDVRAANSFATACQLIAVIFQISSQCQFGGVASANLDYELAPFVRISFLKHYRNGLKYAERRISKDWHGFSKSYKAATRKTASIIAKANIFKDYSKVAYNYAIDILEKEGLQSTQAMYHNLNTLESRPGSQLPFTSINFGLDTSFEGRKVSEWCLKASIEGIGKFHQTPIFPISIFKIKKDINDRPGTPNYDLKRLAVTSLCKRLYPNFVNSDWSMNKADKLPSQYIVPSDLYPISKINVRIGSKYYSNITVEDLYNLLYKSNIGVITNNPKVFGYIDLRFSKRVVCINDNNSCYKDYAIKINERMAKINYITYVYKDGKYMYGITTDSFGFELGNKHIQYSIPDYDYDTEMASMGCRTLLGLDVNGMGYKKTGRGNVSPVTINLAKIGIENGICLNKRKKPNLKGFFNQLDKMLNLAEKSLLNRFKYICSQNYMSGFFMYVNGNMADSDKVLKTGNVYESMKHGTQGLGYIGLAECCYALFGKYHNQDSKVLDFAIRVVKRIHEYAKDATKRNHLNFSAYASPAENCCYTICKNLQKEYGKIPGVCDRDYLTNSHHVPVFEKVSIYDKIDIESKFTCYPTGGCITYNEFESAVMQNPEAVEKVIDYAMVHNIPYYAINFPVDNCMDCGYSQEMEDSCPKCNSHNIKKLRRVTGYLSVDYHKFNKGKQQEVKDRCKHSKYTK
jgi:ribonucleoside-triphosphate reductase